MSLPTTQGESLSLWRRFITMLREEGVAFYRNGDVELHLSPLQPALPKATSKRAETDEPPTLTSDSYLWSEDGDGEPPTLPRL